MMRSLSQKIISWRKRRQIHQPLITVEINQRALLQNLHALHSIAPTWSIAPVLKSNAYGHGLTLIAELLQHEKCIPFFCVDSYAEAELIRAAGIQKPVVILGYTPTNTIIKNRWPHISYVISSAEQLRTIINQRVHIHLKFDTGMHRQGIMQQQYNEIFRILKQSRVTVEGILSHLADAEVPHSPITQQQIHNWNLLARRAQQSFPVITYYHLANSAGFAYASDMLANVGRPGIALYGINPGNLPVQLEPILQMKSVISAIRSLPTGESIGYNAAHVTRRNTRVATIPVGYFEGIDRRLSNRGVVKIHRAFAPLLGRVSMNVSSCDVTDIPEANIGTPVIIISNSAADHNSVAYIAQLCHTVPHEILAHIAPTLRRVVVPR